MDFDIRREMVEYDLDLHLLLEVKSIRQKQFQHGYDSAHDDSKSCESWRKTSRNYMDKLDAVSDDDLNMQRNYWLILCSICIARLESLDRQINRNERIDRQNK